jgi:hypothetical protein
MGKPVGQEYPSSTLIAQGQQITNLKQLKAPSIMFSIILSHNNWKESVSYLKRDSSKGSMRAM